MGIKLKEEIVHIEHLNLSFGDHHVLRGFELSVHAGEVVCIIGKSGSGKSVLLKCMAGLLKPSKGKVYVFGKDLTGITEKELNQLRSNMGFVFQSNALYDSLTVKENLEFGLVRNRPELKKDEVGDKIIKVLNDVGLAHTLNLYPSELSGGMQKRIAIARAIVMEPKLILFDEPTAGLDVITSREISRLILKLQGAYNSTMVIITHDFESIKIIHQKVVILNEGRNQWSGNYEEMLQSEDPLIREYLNQKT